MSQDVLTFFAGLSKPVLAGIATMVAVQLGLQIWALGDLVRRDSVRFRAKWLWALIIIAGSFLGAIIYFGFGRIPKIESAELAASPVAGERVDAGLDRLYRDQDRP